MARYILISVYVLFSSWAYAGVLCSAEKCAALCSSEKVTKDTPQACLEYAAYIKTEIKKKKEALSELERRLYGKPVYTGYSAETQRLMDIQIRDIYRLRGMLAMAYEAGCVKDIMEWFDGAAIAKNCEARAESVLDEKMIYYRTDKEGRIIGSIYERAFCDTAWLAMCRELYSKACELEKKAAGTSDCYKRMGEAFNGRYSVILSTVAFYEDLCRDERFSYVCDKEYAPFSMFCKDELKILKLISRDAFSLYCSENNDPNLCDNMFIRI